MKIHIQRQRRKHRKKTHSNRKIKIVTPRAAKQFYALTPQAQDRWIRVTHAVSKMRSDHVSLREASREFGLDPRVVTRLAKSALRKRKNGQYAAKPTDKLLRILAIPAPDEKGGKREIAVRDSRQATILGRYWAAVQKYLQTGDFSALNKFRGKRITDASGKRVPLLTDLTELDRLGSAGVWSFESIYSQVA
ncbi:MAG: hypothetical protein ACYDCM_16885 [Candidatus Acidiferrales bacterium]